MSTTLIRKRAALDAVGPYAVALAAVRDLSEYAEPEDYAIVFNMVGRSVVGADFFGSEADARNARKKPRRSVTLPEPLTV